MLFVGRADPLPLGGVEVARDGSFSATSTVPPGIPPGEAAVSFVPVPYDCADGESCAGYSAGFVIR